jgi:hypothetical protein
LLDNISGIAWNGTMWIAVGDGPNIAQDTRSNMIYSYDGINWTNNVSFATLARSQVYAIAWNGSVWVAGGYKVESPLNLYYSSDGLNWTRTASTLFNLVNKIAWNGTMFVAIGAYIYGGGENNVFTIFGLLALYYVFITQQWSPKKLLSYVNWEVILVVGAVIILGNYFKMYENEYSGYIKSAGLDPTTFLGMLMISLVGFTASFLMGSSGKFVAFAVLLAQLFGPAYFLWFFAVDYAGYLLSPTHKCVMVGNRYFGTPYRTYYLALGSWAFLLLLTAGIFIFL